jgi:serine/threonine protein kinase
MEWLEGEDLAARLDRGPLSLAAALLVGRAVAGVLGYAHARGLTHRDLKPANIYLVDGDVARVRVLDFGIARDLAEAEITATGTILGTPQYMPPEQAIDAKRADARSDVFALGAILFHCLTGEEPYHGKTLHEVFSHVVVANMRRVSDVVPFVPEELDALVARMVSRDPGARPATGPRSPSSCRASPSRATSTRRASRASGPRPRASPPGRW